MSSAFRLGVSAMVALGVAYLGACSLGLDGLSGGSTTPDAGADAGSSDAGASASIPDSATDSTTTATVACPDHSDAIFCDELDGSVLASSWTPNESAGGTLSLVDASLLATVPIGGTNGAVAEANVVATFPMSGTKYRTYVDFYIESTGNRGAYLDDITLDDGTHIYDLQLFARSDITNFQTDVHLPDGGFSTITTALPGYTTLPTEIWLRALMDVDYSAAGSPTYSLALENPRGTSAITLIDHAAIEWPYTPTHMSVAIGAIDVNEQVGNPWHVFFENFALTPE